jgi:molecular chaperone HtpG
VPLVLFQSSSDPEKLTTLKEYVGRMRDGQDEIYYLTGESRAAVENSPHLEAFRAKGYEVLYLTEPVDELMTEGLFEFEGKKLHSVAKGTVELGTDAEKKQAQDELAEKQQQYASLFELLQKELASEVKEVRLSARLTSSPVCLVGSESDLSPQLERLLKRAAHENLPKQLRIMELNPQHPLLEKMHQRFEQNHDDPLLKDYARLLLGYALLAEGSQLADPVGFNRQLAELMLKAL